MPRISVVMSFRDPGPGLRDALISLLWQDERNWELIVIDDGSRDGSAEIPLLHEDSRIRLVRHEESAGLAVRLNEAIRLARGRYVARMDADDIAFPQRFSIQADFLERQPEIDLLASAVLMIDEHDLPVGVVPSPENHAELTARAWFGIPMPHPTWMGRREWFIAHPYDERARKAQDQHLLYRTYRVSRFAAISQPLLAYRYPRLSASKTLLSRYHTLRARWETGSVADALRATVLHSIAAVRDLLAITMGMDRTVINRRTRPADTTLLSEWAQLVARMNFASAGRN